MKVTGTSTNSERNQGCKLKLFSYMPLYHLRLCETLLNCSTRRWNFAVEINTWKLRNSLCTAVSRGTAVHRLLGKRLNRF